MAGKFSEKIDKITEVSQKNLPITKNPYKEIAEKNNAQIDHKDNLSPKPDALKESSESLSQIFYNRIHKTQLLCLQNLSLLIKIIFCGKGTKRGSQFICSGWTIALEVFFCKEVNDFIMPGGWVNRVSKQYSNDIISLHAIINKVPYYSSLIQIEEFFENFNLPNKNTNKKELWVQEKTPLSNPKFNNLIIYSFNSDIYKFSIKNTYFNKSGKIIGAREHLCIIGNNTEIYRYRTIWKNKRTHIGSWMPFFPQPPYMIYNMHLIKISPTIVFMHDENLADKKPFIHQYYNSSSIYYKAVYSTCPGGLVNLPEADFSLLNGKIIIIQLDKIKHPALNRIPEAIKKLKKAGASKIHISFLRIEAKSITNVQFGEDGIYIHLTADNFLLWLDYYNGNRENKNDSIQTNTKPLPKMQDAATNYNEIKSDSVSAKKPRIPKRIKEYAKIAFLRKKNISYAKIEKDYGIKHSHAHNIITKRIMHLTEKEEKLLKLEMDRLNNEEEAKLRLLNEEERLDSAESGTNLIYNSDKKANPIDRPEIDCVESMDELVKAEDENSTIKGSASEDTLIDKEKPTKIKYHPNSLSESINFKNLLAGIDNLSKDNPNNKIISEVIDNPDATQIESPIIATANDQK